MSRALVAALLVCSACSEPELLVGAGSIDITPTEFEVWRDCGRDAKCPEDPGYPGKDADEADYEYDYGEKFIDCGVDRLCPGDDGYTAPDRGEADGKFQELRLAGFQGEPFSAYQGRPMVGRHDDIEFNVLAMKRGDTVFVLIVGDTVGFFHRLTNAIRRELRDDPELKLDPAHVVVAATHTHNAPDSMGIWSQFDPEETWLPSLMGKAKIAVKQAMANLKPARMYAAHVTLPSCRDGDTGEIKTLENCREPLSEALRGAGPDFPVLETDLRDPFVRDMQLTALRFEAKDGSGTISTLLNWSTHPEALSDTNSLVSTDFIGYARKYVKAKLGGQAVYVSGAVGGMMSPLRGTEAPRWNQDMTKGEGWISESGFKKIWSLGYTIGDEAVRALAGAKAEENPTLAFETRDISFQVDNAHFALAFGEIIGNYFSPEDQSFDTIDNIATVPMTFATLGTATFVTFPGELLPEFWVGRKAITVDYALQNWPEIPFPAIPGLRERMPGEHRFMIGLANNEIGYLVPEPDFLEDGSPLLAGKLAEDHPNYYEELVSPGKKVGTLLCDLALELAGVKEDCFGNVVP